VTRIEGSACCTICTSKTHGTQAHKCAIAADEARERKAMTTSKAVGPNCGCNEYPECTHSLYWYQGFKAGQAHQQALVGTGVPLECPDEWTMVRTGFYNELLAVAERLNEALREKVVKAALDYAFTSELPYDLRRAVRELREAT
jgi:hypothetical protein